MLFLEYQVGESGLHQVRLERRRCILPQGICGIPVLRLPLFEQGSAGSTVVDILRPPNVASCATTGEHRVW